MGLVFLSLSLHFCRAYFILDQNWRINWVKKTTPSLAGWEGDGGQGEGLREDKENIHPLWKTILISLVTITKQERKQKIYGPLGTSDHPHKKRESCPNKRKALPSPSCLAQGNLGVLPMAPSSLLFLPSELLSPAIVIFLFIYLPIFCHWPPHCGGKPQLLRGLSVLFLHGSHHLEQCLVHSRGSWLNR